MKKRKKTKCCIWCSKECGRDVFHPREDFGKLTRSPDGLKMSCRLSLMLRETKKRENKRLDFLKEAFKPVKINTPLGLHALHRYKCGNLQTSILWDRQEVLTKPWRRDRARRSRLAA